MRPRITAEPIEAPPMPRELDARRLVRRGLVVVAALVVLGLVALLAPGLGEVRALLERASPAWLALAVALEVGSSLSYVAMFHPVFCKRMSWRSTFEISFAELAVGSIVPASGAGGVALGAWFLSRAGMPARPCVAQRSIAFLLIKSSVNFAAVAVLGVLLWLGVGPQLSPLLTILPAVLATVTLAGVPLAASWLASAGARLATGRRSASVAAAIHDGVAEAGRLLRGRDAMLVGGAVGYWIFDNLVLLATFHAFGLFATGPGRPHGVPSRPAGRGAAHSRWAAAAASTSGSSAP